ncbi:hypothetical protein K438DRAFT_1756024 [Mycena galopus ATCC 62051]|nr:hypothetical protein K438DRAFT_1756024 [Mycena galopus ATCC 62051]
MKSTSALSISTFRVPPPVSRMPGTNQPTNYVHPFIHTVGLAARASYKKKQRDGNERTMNTTVCLAQDQRCAHPRPWKQDAHIQDARADPQYRIQVQKIEIKEIRILNERERLRIRKRLENEKIQR